MKLETKKKALRRLKIIEGQVRGLGRMIENDTYCIDVIKQSRAIKEALAGVEEVMLENHLKTHVVEQMKSGKEKKAIEEMLTICRASRKR